METNRAVHSIQNRKKLVPAFGFLLALLVAFPSLSRAEHRHHGHGNPHGHSRKAYLEPRFRPPVPRRLIVQERSYTQPFFTGRSYYRPHHHYHAAYRFPVFVNGVVAYRPFHYCGDRIFVSAAVPIPPLAFSLNFGGAGWVIGSDFYASGAYVSYRHDD